MKNSPHSGAERGFTIIEVMLVLAVSGLILASAVLLFDGKQGTTEFNVAANQFQTQIQSIINDAGNGYNPTAGSSQTFNFNCSGQATGTPVFTSIVSSQGSNGSAGSSTNTGCIFLGRVIEFSAKSSSFNVYSVVGDQYEPSVIPYTLAEGITDSDPILLANADTGGQNQSFLPQPSQYSLEYGTYIQCIETFSSAASSFIPANCTPSSTTVGSIAFVIGANVSNSQASVAASSMAPLNQPSFVNTDTPIAQVVAINKALSGNPTPITVNPAGGVYICLSNSVATRSALISIGINNQEPVVNLAMKTSTNDGNCTQ